MNNRILLPNCSDLLWEKFFQNVCKFLPFSLEFQKFFSITRIFLTHSRSEQFGNKIPFLLLFLWQTCASKVHFCPCTFDSFEIFVSHFFLFVAFIWTLWPFSSVIGVLDRTFSHKILSLFAFFLSHLAFFILPTSKNRAAKLLR